MEMAGAGIQINLMLMALNLLPIPPLDGVASRQPVAAFYAMTYAKMEPYGFILVIVRLATGFLIDLMRPILRVAEFALSAIIGL